MRPKKTVMLCLISKLQLGVYTPRTSYNPKYIRDLASSMKIEGQNKPIIVQFKEETPFPVIDGEYRVKALKLSGEKTVRAEVWKVSDAEALFYAMRINEMHGKRLDMMEEAMHLDRMLKEDEGLTQQKLARRFNKQQDWVSARILLVNKLAPEVKTNITERSVMTPTQAVELTKLPDEQQIKVAEFIEKENPTVKETRFLVDLVEKQPAKAEDLLEKNIPYLRAEMKHEEIIETEARLEEVMTKSKEPWVEDHICSECGAHFKINWKEGLIEWLK